MTKHYALYKNIAQNELRPHQPEPAQRGYPCYILQGAKASMLALIPPRRSPHHLPVQRRQRFASLDRDHFAPEPSSTAMEGSSTPNTSTTNIDTNNLRACSHASLEHRAQLPPRMSTALGAWHDFSTPCTLAKDCRPWSYSLPPASIDYRRLRPIKTAHNLPSQHTSIPTEQNQISLQQ